MSGDVQVRFCEKLRVKFPRLTRLPLHRQEQMLRRIGIDIPRSTLCLWVIRAAELLKPMMEIYHRLIIQYDVAYSDETTVQVLKDQNKGVSSKKYMWVFAGGPAEKFVFYYQYHHSRTHDVALNFFEGYRGFIHCDGFPGYDTLAAKSRILFSLVACIMQGVNLLKLLR